MKKRWTGLRTFFLCLLGYTIFFAALQIGTKGMPLIGVPDATDVQKVTIAYTEVTDEAREFTDAENIDLAVNLTNFLNYSLTKQHDKAEPSGIEITYTLTNGEAVTVTANEDTVWWKGHAHAIKDEGFFTKVATGIFFLEYIVEE